MANMYYDGLLRWNREWADTKRELGLQREREEAEILDKRLQHLEKKIKSG